MYELTSNHSGMYFYQNIQDYRIYIEVATYPNDGHFYYKRFTKDTYDDFKFKRIRKSDLLEILKDYTEVKEWTLSDCSKPWFNYKL